MQYRLRAFCHSQCHAQALKQPVCCFCCSEGGSIFFFFRTIVSAFMVEKIVILSFSEKLSFFFLSQLSLSKRQKKVAEQSVMLFANQQFHFHDGETVSSKWATLTQQKSLCSSTYFCKLICPTHLYYIDMRLLSKKAASALPFFFFPPMVQDASDI